MKFVSKFISKALMLYMVICLKIIFSFKFFSTELSYKRTSSKNHDEKERNTRNFRCRTICRFEREEKTSSIESSASLFIFTTCQGGTEKHLKAEIQKRYRGSLRSAFSRPGFVSFKCVKPIRGICDDTCIDPALLLQSMFARTYGISIGLVEEVDSIISLAKEVSRKVARKLRLHVFPRDEVGARTEHPDYIISKERQVLGVKEAIKLRSIELGIDESLWLPAEADDEETPTKDSEFVLDVIVGEPTEKYFVGYHKYLNLKDSGDRHYSFGLLRNSYPGGRVPIVLPLESPSRAYLKMEEALHRTGFPMRPDDVAVEIGSAPGGVCYSLLRRGLRVVGVDPTPPDRTHSPVVANHPNFSFIKSKLHTLDLATLPAHIDWLLCDANIPFDEALPHLIGIAQRARESLKGVYFTCKLSDDLWQRPEVLVDYIDAMQERVRIGCFLSQISAVQLLANRNEVLLFGLTKIAAGRNKERR